jgi:hypothetical protein
VPGSFDVLHCASTYHYFRDRQAEFLDAAAGALADGGTLVLEVELAPEDAGSAVVWRSRKVDAEPCAFPTKEAFLKQIEGTFQVEAEFPSVPQGGSFYPRTYVHLRRSRAA